MAFFFTCGTHTFNSLLAGSENIQAQCQNCGNFSARVYKRWEWFTLCFVPLIPFSLKPYHVVGCHICNFNQDIKFRPDVQSQMNGGQEGGGAGNAAVPMQNYGGQNQGWNQGPPGAPQQYNQGGQQPQYK